MRGQRPRPQLLEAAEWSQQARSLMLKLSEDSGASRFPSISVFFGSVETKWVPEAYFYRQGKVASPAARAGKDVRTPIAMVSKMTGHMRTPCWALYG